MSDIEEESDEGEERSLCHVEREKSREDDERDGVSSDGSHVSQFSRERYQLDRKLNPSVTAPAALGPSYTSSIDEKTRKAVDLHEEIVQAMLEKNVDPFERSYRRGNDPVVLDVTAKAPKLLQGTISLKYWREFAANKRYLETRSAQHLKTSTDLTTVLKKKKISERVKKGPKKKIQDVRQPPSNQVTYSFAAPPTGFPLFDSHIIGPRNPVRDLVEDQNGNKSSPTRLPFEASAISPKKLSPKKPLKPLIAPGDIGTALPGGVMRQGRAREPQSIPITANIPFPTVNELDGKRTLPGGQFPLSIRFPNTTTRSAETIEPPKSVNQTTDKFRGRFSENPRFPQNAVETFAPNPGTYQVTRLFDDVKPKLSSQRAEELITQIREQKGLRDEPCVVLSEKAVFGYGCSYEEHVLYGMCLDGQCARRAKWEDVTLLVNEENRVTGVKPYTQQDDVISVATSASSTTSVSQKPTPDFSPLKSAAMSGDIETIIKLCSLGTDINQIDEEMGRCALHHCASRNYINLVNYLTGGSARWKTSNPQEKSIYSACKKLFKGVIELNIRDHNGDTPLHIASRFGYQDVVEALCDAGADGTSIKNNKNETCADIARTQAIFQIIHLVSAKRDAEKELHQLVKAREKQRHRTPSLSRTGLLSQPPNPENTSGTFVVTDEQAEEDLEEMQHEGKEEISPLPTKAAAQIPHSYMVGYLPPDQAPPPFQGNFKKKKKSAQ